ncbi:putative ion channel protein [Raoultella planticola]|uniref:Putative ion channel protein n=1 Tax=Raoultella planticola TaxID=575 RepID=A0A485BZ62_RAOPL|nr:putative ion channel protein [Raoultella planticola]
MLHPRARTMLLLSIPAVIIGIASSLVLIVTMKIAAILQHVIWSSVPLSLGIEASGQLWTIAVLTLTGIAVGLVVRFSPGHAGPDPATESLIGAPISTGALPGLVAALVLGLAGGVSLGPEHPVMVMNIALAVAIGSRLFPPSQFAGLDHSCRLRHDRRAVWHPGSRRVDFFANPQQQ